MLKDAEIIDKFFREANPNPERKGCPGSETVKRLATNALPLEHPARLHLADCSPCYQEFLKLKEHHVISRRTVVTKALRAAATLVACVALGAVGLYYINIRVSVPGKALSSSIVRTVDLYNVGTFRTTEPNQIINTILLPAAPLKLRVILPRFSQLGKYRVGIVAEKSGQRAVAEGFGSALTEGPRQIVTVTLNLTSAPRGLYFLLTTNGKDDASYYYPVRVD